MKKYNNISVVIVTYNRKQLLLKCLNAVLTQSYLPTVVYVVDNASTDGTENIFSSEVINCRNYNNVIIHYEKLPRNIGGAGGFYTGMKMAHEAGSDAVWMMDDDGLPDEDCLKNMLPHLEKYDYLSPLVVDTENEKMMSFEGCAVEEFLKREKGGVVEGCANPFNGVIFSKKLIDAVGYPKKEMFIWGDEINYNLRAKAAGFVPAMVVNAIHRHPLNRQRYVSYFGKHMMVVPEQDWKLFCLLRNRTYNSKMFAGRSACVKQTIADIIKFGCYYLLQSNQPSKMSVVLKAICKGLKGDFTGLVYSRDEI